MKQLSLAIKIHYRLHRYFECTYHTITRYYKCARKKSNPHPVPPGLAPTRCSFRHVVHPFFLLFFNLFLLLPLLLPDQPYHSTTTTTNLQVVCALFSLGPCIVHNLNFLFLRETAGSGLWSTWELAQHILSSAFDRPNPRVAQKEKRIICICSQS